MLNGIYIITYIYYIYNIYNPQKCSIFWEAPMQTSQYTGLRLKKPTTVDKSTEMFNILKGLWQPSQSTELSWKRPATCQQSTECPKTWGWPFLENPNIKQKAWNNHTWKPNGQPHWKMFQFPNQNFCALQCPISFWTLDTLHNFLDYSG